MTNWTFFPAVTDPDDRAKTALIVLSAAVTV
jgi:hypothetical protein